jgi:GNAT superfamily N-acetyltransferase
VSREVENSPLRPPSPVTRHPSPIRPARPDESSAISALAFRSKAHWGYDAAFLERCREDLSISAKEIATSIVVVHVGPAGIDGFYRLTTLDDRLACLDSLFVDPAAIGAGVGRRLWEHAVSTARALGFLAMEFQSDPHAEGFYLAMGATRIGDSESTVTPGRLLPLMRFIL